ncbi:phosphate acetyltransferase [Oceanivirga miroungae]|uniref:Phosphate acetyltransferase n=1 Tax=Oceanivirga miroungae TaxID=1130046 RepID=A0A6I8M8R1_9FUSO|nr:phosphate acetyltransferase [Oceanivirga miroungae]VWL85205.1 phosphate acetyltransferase [Oceanivirga miroungae]
MSRDLIKEFKQELLKNVKKVVLPETQDERVLRAAAQIQKEKFAKVILVGNVDKITKDANKFGIDISEAEIIDPMTYEKTEEFAQIFAKMREKKGLTYEKALEIMRTDERYFGAMLVKQGIASGMVAGSISPTAWVLRAAIQVIGPKPGLKTVSSSFIMILKNEDLGENGVMVFSDSAVIPDPTPEQLADIAIEAVNKAKTIAKIKEPKVALLSYSTKGSAGGMCVDKITEAKRILDERQVDFLYDGELQLDAAIVPSVAELKAKDSKVAGSANVLIFPNLSAGNIGYKLVQRFAGATALGPFIQGLAKPVHDLSRGCSVEDIVSIVAVTAIEGE